jgi:hypothetical protein
MGLADERDAKRRIESMVEGFMVMSCGASTGGWESGSAILVSCGDEVGKTDRCSGW